MDTQNNNSSLNGKSIVQTFSMQNLKGKNNGYQFIRMRQTSNNWNSDNDLMIGSFEIYGKLILNSDSS